MKRHRRCLQRCLPSITFDIVYHLSHHLFVNHHNVSRAFGRFSSFLLNRIFADDLQRFHYCRPDEIQQLRIATVYCINEIGLWMKFNTLQLNPLKTVFLWVATSGRRRYFDDRQFVIGRTAVKPTIMARNVGVVMNQDFSMKAHIDKLVQSCYYSLCQIWTIRWSPPSMLWGP